MHLIHPNASSGVLLEGEIVVNEPFFSQPRITGVKEVQP